MAEAVVATLLAHPGRSAITPAALARARDALGCASAVDVLAAETAVDLAFDPDGADSTGVEARLREALGPDFDVVVQPAAGRRKRLFLADMDSTMIEQECIDELADHVGLKAAVSAITERAMRGEIAFEPALRERVRLLAGLPVTVVDAILAERITFTPGGRTLVATMRAAGAPACLVSGGFTVFTRAVAARLGFESDRANRLVVADGRLTGLVEEPILGRDAKKATLVELRDRPGLRPADVLAVGDGANDLAMLGEAGLGVAFRAKPAVAAAAHARIDGHDLSALLYLQGYRCTEFVQG